MDYQVRPLHSHARHRAAMVNSEDDCFDRQLRDVQVQLQAAETEVELRYLDLQGRRIAESMLVFSKFVERSGQPKRARQMRAAAQRFLR